MFKVEAKSLEAYFSFDPAREPDLRQLDSFIKNVAPKLKRYFHRGTPAGQPGMRFKMIGYGRTYAVAKNGQKVEWPALGVALQKNYISIYISMRNDGGAITASYAGQLGEWRMADNNFSFKRFQDLNLETFALLLAEIERAFITNPVIMPRER